MTSDEKSLQIALGTYLPLMWEEKNKLHTEGYKLRAEGYKLRAEGHRLCDEGSKLRAEGNLLYINAVIEVYGEEAIINWEDGSVSR